ncbi:MAG: ribose 5-phosphate isomerase A, partial [Pseudanabaena sp. M114S2SP2A07QC]|nr:ribose 5-phosphate isomerase A [Pseudanabaena sp. M114S2SP2A07QC]
MSISAEDIKKLKQEVGIAAAQRVRSGMVVGLGTGSTTAFAIEELGRRIAAGELTDIVGIPTSFQASVLGKKYGIPIRSLDDVDR